MEIEKKASWSVPEQNAWAPVGMQCDRTHSSCFSMQADPPRGLWMMQKTADGMFLSLHRGYALSGLPEREVLN